MLVCESSRGDCVQYVSDPVFAQMQDQVLVVSAAGGNAEAFAVLTERMMPFIHKTAARYAFTSHVDREDLVQEGLLGLLAAVHGYRPESGEFGSYAATCISNRIVSAVRRFGTDAIPVSEQEWLSVDSVGQADPEQLFLEREAAGRLYDRLKRTLTPLEYRVLMGQLSGCSYREIADHNSVSEKAVDNALQRVRRKLSSDFRQ